MLKRLSSVALLTALLLLAWHGASADPLDDAKAAGLVGELPNGYVAAVESNPSRDIAALVKQINRKRQAAYADIANETGAPADQVGALTAEKIKAQAAPGAYFMSQEGTWEQN